MKKLIKIYKNNKSGFFYISSGLFKTFIQTIAGFIVLRWIAPEEIGQWQSFTVFVGYLNILTLGVTSGLNRELPYWIGKGNTDLGMQRLKVAGAFITGLSLIIMGIALVVSLLSYFLSWLSLDHSLMFFAAISIGALFIQTNLLGATYRSDKAFKKLGYIQFGLATFHFVLLPIVYLYGIWGYIIYQALIALILYIGFSVFRPYRVNYLMNKTQLKALIQVGFPMYVWNYLSEISRTIPRLTLVIFGSPLLVGLFAPAESINKAVLNLPSYINRFLFPRMSFDYGKNDNQKEIVRFTMRAATMLFITMLIIAIILALLMPFVFELLFPKYVESTTIVQIVIFSGVFYSLNALIHNSINSLKLYRFFKIIIPLKILFMLLSITLCYLLTLDLLLAVASGLVIAEILNTLSYLYFLNFKIKSTPTIL